MSFELAENEAREIFTETDITRMMAFFESAAKACTDCGRTYLFVCPICGATARAERARGNGHLHAHCPGCGVGVMQ